MKVIITGFAGEGKTVVAQIIMKALREEGIKVAAVDRDGTLRDRLVNDEHYQSALNSIVERETKVVVYEIHGDRLGRIPIDEIDMINIGTNE